MTRASRSEKTVVWRAGFSDSYYTANASLPFLSLKLNNSSRPEVKIGKFKFRAKHFCILPQRGICSGKLRRDFTLEKKKLLEEQFGMLNGL